MKAVEYQIKAISNLHVGSGEINMGVVDNLVQTDAATGFPVINASSLKGALREHVSQLKADDKMICSVFGSKPNDDNVREAGNYRFFDANLLAMPVRGNKRPFIMGTCPLLIRDYMAKRDLFGHSLDEQVKAKWQSVLEKAKESIPTVLDASCEGALIEDFEHPAVVLEGHADVSDLCELLGGPGVLFSDADFLRLCDEDHLPVMARNNLTVGHRNLWYEQVLPRFSRLSFYVLIPDDDSNFRQFNESVTSSLVQIGANATVGYGYCELTRPANLK